MTREEIDVVDEEKFAWRPYTDRLIQRVIPQDVRTGAWSTACSIICFEVVEWHAADRVRRQFGLMQPVPRDPHSLGDSHNQDIKKTEDWETKHAKWIRRWDHRERYVQQGHPTGTYVPSQEYWDWYLRYASRTFYLSAAYRKIDPTQRVLPPRFPQRTRWPVEYEQPQPWMWQIPEGPGINPTWIDPARMSCDTATFEYGGSSTQQNAYYPRSSVDAYGSWGSWEVQQETNYRPVRGWGDEEEAPVEQPEDPQTEQPFNEDIIEFDLSNLSMNFESSFVAPDPADLVEYSQDQLFCDADEAATMSGEGDAVDGDTFGDVDVSTSHSVTPPLKARVRQNPRKKVPYTPTEDPQPEPSNTKTFLRKKLKSLLRK